MEFRTTSTLIPFLEARTWMQSRVTAIQTHTAPECVWFLEHEPFYARGRSATDTEYHPSKAPDIPVYDVQRGGKYTYHGPGQRVVYLMLDLNYREKDIKKYIHALEEWIISALSDLGIQGFRAPMGIGVWVEHQGVCKKIAAIGVHISKWVTSYGVALNIDTDLGMYRGITPCGIAGYDVTNLKVLGCPWKTDKIDDMLIDRFKKNKFLREKMDEC